MPSPFPAPFPSGPYKVRPEWIDHNGHLNLAYYVMLFDEATDALWGRIGLGAPLRATGFATFAAEGHIFYRAELLEGQQVTVQSQVLGCDAKRLHVAHTMWRDGVISAQQELMYLCVSFATRRVAPWPAAVRAQLEAGAAAHAALPRPDWVGHKIALPG